MKVLSVINQKGGVAKSTTASALANGLQDKGYKVLAIDLDGQRNLTYSMGLEEEGPSALELLTGQATALECISKTTQTDLIGGSPNLYNISETLQGVGVEHKLKEALEPLEGLYDYIIIDTPPSLSVLTINALTASHYAIIPAQADIYSMQGIGQLAETIQVVQKYTNPSLVILGIVLTRHNPRTILSKDLEEMIEETANSLGTIKFNTFIRENVAVKEAQAMRASLFTYALKSNAGIDYKAFLEEVLTRIEEVNHGKEKLQK